MGTGTTKRPEKSRARGFDLPPGYLVRSYGRLLSDPNEPCFWNLYRHDDEKDTFVIVEDSLGRQDVEPTARRDHLRRTLSTIDGGRCTPGMPDGYGLFEHQGDWVVARPDNSVAATLSIYATTEDTTRAAWDDYRRRMLRVLRAEPSQVEADRGGHRCG